MRKANSGKVRGAIAALVWLAAVADAAASSAPKEGGEGGGGAATRVVAVQRVKLDPPPIISSPIGGLRVVVNQINYPGVPDRSSCRFTVHVVNDGHDTFSAYALLRTRDGEKAELNTWMVPTGILAPGQSSDRLYSCKTAQYLELDRTAMGSWPGRCVVNGEERSPCPLSLMLEANMNLIGGGEAPAH